jgi:hypothetical protein
MFRQIDFLPIACSVVAMGNLLGIQSMKSGSPPGEIDLSDEVLAYFAASICNTQQAMVFG